jgi:SAM-dependent methyltransferase
MNSKIFFRKIINTFLKRNLFGINYSHIYKKNNFLFTHLSKFFFFIPSNHEALYWKNSENLNHGHEKFIEMSDLSLLLKKEICIYASKNDKILDICCSVGRLLNSLCEDGFFNLYGFDINKTAIDESKIVFPKLKNIFLTCQPAEEYLSNKVDNEFDITFSMTASIELISSSYPLLREISRITKKYFICLIDENGHAYPRFWRYEFKKNSFLILKSYKVNNSLTMFVLKKKNYV